jgi:hypothetical protein
MHLERDELGLATECKSPAQTITPRTAQSKPCATQACFQDSLCLIGKPAEFAFS